MSTPTIIHPNWPAPDSIRAFATTRQGGVSLAPFDSFNLARHVEDDHPAVTENRQRLKQHLDLPNEPLWLQQTHSTIALNTDHYQGPVEADAIYTNKAQKICTVMTADCLPILLCQQQGKEVAAIHAGWRGLAGGVIENCVQALQSPTHEIMAWLGPAISMQHFIVGPEVREMFIKRNPDYASAFEIFADRYKADLYQLAQICLKTLGISAIFSNDHCTYQQDDLFFSHRRDGPTGRMASLIWIAD